MSDELISNCTHTTLTAPGWLEGDCLYTPYYQFLWQLTGIIAILVWTISLSTIIFFICWYFEILRVEQDVEVRGIDIAKHGEPAYPTTAYGHGWDNEGKSLTLIKIINCVIRSLEGAKS